MKPLIEVVAFFPVNSDNSKRMSRRTICDRSVSAKEQILWLPLGLGVCYLATLGGMATAGIHTRIPWDLFAHLVIKAVPFACCTVWIAMRAKRWSGVLVNISCIAGGLLGLYSYQKYAVWGLGALLLFYLNRKLLTRSRIIAVTLTVTSLWLFCATVFNCNYLLMKLVAHRVHDSELASIDCWLYSLAMGHPISYDGIFPLFRNRSLFGLFEHGYAILFAEVMLTGFLIAASNSRRDLLRFFGVLCTIYSIGLVTFAIFPAVGPPIAFPHSLAPDFHNTITYRMMNSEWADFQALVQGKAINGVGYFIAMPSLHVLESVILQGFLRRSSVLFWAFAPINAVIVCSTVVLGQHYIVDLLTGLALGIIIWPFTYEPPVKAFKARQQSKASLDTLLLQN